jgi:hypothetical protein
MQQTLDESRKDPGEKSDVGLSSDEVDDWMRLFKTKKGERK